MNHLSRLSLLLPLAFFVGAAIQYIGISSGPGNILRAMYVRDAFIIFSLVLSLPLINKQKWASDRNVLRGLRHLFFLIIVTSSILFLSKTRVGAIEDFSFDSDLLNFNLSDNIFVVSWAFFATIFILISLGTLKNLIYVKRRKNTARNFTLLMISLLAYSFFSLPQIYPESKLGLSSGYETINTILLFILINFMVINSLRVGWINYLNKKQKLGCFWGSLILLPLQVIFTVTFQSMNPLVPFSPLLERFIEMGMLFLTIYLFTSFFSLLGHLPTAKLYDRKMSQMQSLHSLSRSLNSEFNKSVLVKTIVKLAAEVSEAEFTWLQLYDTHTGKLSLQSSKALTATERTNWKSFYEYKLVEYLSTLKSVFICNEVAKNEYVQGLTKWKRDLNSLIVVPLITSDRIIGFLYCGKSLEFGFEHDDAETLRAFVDQAVIAVENARLVEESLVKERLEQELRIAHEAQMKLLPKTMPTVPGVKIDAVCITANEVGGDYYDFFELGKSKLGIVIGDVSGKGPSAAFYMAEVKGIMEALANEVLSPQEMLVAANEILYKNFDRRTFISVIYGILDVKSGWFTFCRAGHCPVYFVANDNEHVERLEPKGLGVGLDSGKIFEKSLQQKRIKLKMGDTFLLFTDGCTEARNPQGHEFGEEQLAQLFEKYKNKPPIEIKKRIIHEIFTFLDGENVYDDLTFIIMQVSKKESTDSQSIDGGPNGEL